MVPRRYVNKNLERTLLIALDSRKKTGFDASSDDEQLFVVLTLRISVEEIAPCLCFETIRVAMYAKKWF